MRNENHEYYRQRARAECEAAFNAACPEARRAHAEMALAYERLAEIADLEQRGDLPAGKVVTLTEALRDRDDAEIGGHAPRPRMREA